MHNKKLSDAIEKEFIDKHIDRELTLSLLERYNKGEFAGYSPPQVDSFPQIDGSRIVDTTESLSFALNYEDAAERLEATAGIAAAEEVAVRRNKELIFDDAAVEKLGLRLLPYTAYGILNGGSATSYADEKKNLSFHRGLFELNREIFENFAGRAGGKPKGLTPAFIQEDGSAGPSFLELKLRSLLLLTLRCRRNFGGSGASAAAASDRQILPLFQMTGMQNAHLIAEALDEYRSSPLLKELIEATGRDVTRVLTGVQPLIAAYSHSSLGSPKKLFTRAWGRENSLLPLPGGHGQNFIALKEIYRDLYRRGYRYAYLSNIDNLGNTVDPRSLALTALSGKRGAFEFSFKTPVDVKGGVLIRDDRHRLNAVDIGAAVSQEEIAAAEGAGKPILFNCATGLFDLSLFFKEIDRIIRELPTRFSDQDKDAGKYSQAEQITWEIIGMMDDPLILGVDKRRRFIAAKIFLENLISSGIGLESPAYPKELRSLADSLHRGLEKLLEEVYGMKKEASLWKPKSVEEL
jgi:UTP--glucose-1-phosphate uridylyltransferase